MPKMQISRELGWKYYYEIIENDGNYIRKWPDNPWAVSWAAGTTRNVLAYGGAILRETINAVRGK